MNKLGEIQVNRGNTYSLRDTLEQARRPPQRSLRAPAFFAVLRRMSQLRVHALRDMRRQPLNGVVPHDVVGPAFELAIPNKLLADVLSRFFMLREQPFMGRVTRSTLAKRLRLQEAVHLLLQTFVVLEGVVAVRRFST